MDFTSNTELYNDEYLFEIILKPIISLMKQTFLIYGIITTL